MDSAEYRQSLRIADHVFPIVRTGADRDDTRVEAVLGTGFFVDAQENLGMTARHVLNEGTPGNVGILINDNTQWRLFAISTVESHPTEDAAVFTVHPPSLSSSWTTFIRARAHFAFSSFRYQLWGYPADVMYEVVQAGVALQRPDLVYGEGYVRRRMTNITLDGIRGTRFLELSQRAGPGYSGGPVIARDRTANQSEWDAIGIYVGERVSSDGFSVGYALRFDSMKDWAPAMLGHRFIASGDPRFEP